MSTEYKYEIHVEGVRPYQAANLVERSLLVGASIIETLNVWQGDKKEHHATVTPGVTVVFVGHERDRSEVLDLAEQLCIAGDQLTVYVVVTKVEKTYMVEGHDADEKGL